MIHPPLPEMPWGHASRRRATFLLILVGALLHGGHSAGGQGALPEPVPGSDPPTLTVSSFPGSYEVIPRAVELAEAAAAARQDIGRLGDLGRASRQIGQGRREQEEIDRLLAELLAEPYLARNALVQLKARVITQLGNLGPSINEVENQLKHLDQIRSDWLARQVFWRGWSQALSSESEFQVLGEELRRALEIIDGVLDSTQERFAVMLDLQRELEQLQRRRNDLLGRIDEELRTDREWWLRRDSPVLLSPTFLRQVRDSRQEVLNGVRRVSIPGWPFVERYLWMLVLQALAALGVGVFARRLGRSEVLKEHWADVLRHPWAVGIFVATATFGFLYEPAPPVWDLGQWTALAICGALLASALFASRRKQRVVYVLAVLYPVLTALEVIALPTPWYRLFLASVSAGALPLLLVTARRQDRELGRQSVFGFALRAGTVALVLALVVEILGFDTLSRWLVRSSVATAFVVFVVSFLLRLGQGGIQALTQREAAGRFAALSRVGVLLGRQLTWLLQGALLLLALVYILDIWGLFPSPLAAWTAFVHLGFEVGDNRFSLGKGLLGALAVYLAFVVSTVLRAALDTELVERQELDSGVGNSIKTLLHYAVVVLGFLLALGLLGIDLQSFAIVLGALGVGVGFGLQNIVNNFLSGLILLFERPVRVGDTVVVDGEWGTIKKIGLRSTVVVSFDQSEMIVPNSELVSQKVTNWTLSDRVTRVVIPVGVAYGSDVPGVLRILEQVAAAHPAVLRDPAPSTLFVAFGDSSLELELRVWVAEISDRLPVRTDLLSAIDRQLRQAGIEIPFPQRDLHLRSVDARAAERLRGTSSELDRKADSADGAPAVPEPDPDVPPRKP